MVYIGSITIKLLRVILIYHSIVSYIWFMCLLFYSLFFLHSSCCHGCCFFSICISLLFMFTRSTYSLESTFIQKVCQCLLSLWCWLPVYTYIRIGVFICAVNNRCFASQSMIVEILQHVHNPNRNINVLHFDFDRICSFVQTFYRSVCNHGRPRTLRTLWLGICFTIVNGWHLFSFVIFFFFSTLGTHLWMDFISLVASLGFLLKRSRLIPMSISLFYHENRIIYSGSL